MASVFGGWDEPQRRSELASVREPYQLQFLFRNLGLTEEEGVEQLIRVAESHPDLHMRSLAVRRLPFAEDPQVVEAIANVLLGDECIGVREAAAGALGEVGDSAAVEPLIAALSFKGDDFLDVRKEAISALGKLGHPRAIPALVSALTDDYEEVSRYACGALEKLPRTEELRSIMVSLLAKHPKAHVRAEAARVLGRQGSKEDVPLLLAVLRRLRDENVCSGAAYALGEIGDKRAVAPLVKTLTENSRSLVRYMAASALGKIGDRRAVPALITALQQDEDNSVRNEAARALGRLRDSRAVVPLIAAVESEQDRYSREGFVEGLQTFADVRIVPSFLARAGERGIPDPIISMIDDLLDKDSVAFPERDLKDLVALPRFTEKVEKILERREWDEAFQGQEPDASTPVRVTCICGAEHKAKGELKGQRFQCRKCALLLTVHEYASANEAE